MSQADQYRLSDNYAKRGFAVSDEFQKRFRPLNDMEATLLEQSLIETEGPIVALVIWEEMNVLIDGYHRLHICENLGLEYDVIRLSFASEREAVQFVMTIQGGRRNLNEIEYKVMLGRLYNKLKRQGQRNDLKPPEDDCRKSLRERIVQELKEQLLHELEEHGVPSERTLRDYGVLAEAIEAMTPKEKELVLQGLRKTPLKDIVDKYRNRDEDSPNKKKRRRTRTDTSCLTDDIDRTVIARTDFKINWNQIRERHRLRAFRTDILFRPEGVVYLERGQYRVVDKYKGLKGNTEDAD